MNKKMIDHNKKLLLQPAYGLWKRYCPAQAQYAFKAGNLPEARTWQRKTRRALTEVLGLHAIESVPLRPRKIEEVDKGSYVREKILMRTGEYSLMPVYVLLPKQYSRPLPVVLAFHGHGYGVKDIVGLWEDGRERDTPDGYHNDFALALCKAGFAVAAPEISCFGERQTDFSYLNTQIGQPVPSTCGHAAMLAFHLGLSVVGLRVHEGIRLVDYLETRRDIDVGRLGAMGISGGGMHTFFSTCLDKRIKASVISGYYSTFRDSILAMSHCPCNFVPGLAQFGEMHDLAGCIAPRPFLVEAGNYDPIFPISAVRKSVGKAKAVYRVFRAAGAIETDYFVGRHRISGRISYDFLRRHLRCNRTTAEPGAPADTDKLRR